MGRWTDRLTARGITLPLIPDPVGGYAPAVRSGPRVHHPGQLPFVGGALPITGNVGVEEAADLAGTAALDALAAVDPLVGIDAAVRVVRMAGSVASAPSFTGQALVVNGASEFLPEIFGPAGAHPRRALGLAVLSLDSPAEVES